MSMSHSRPLKVALTALVLALVAQSAVPESPSIQAVRLLEGQREELGLSSLHTFKVAGSTQEASGQSHVRMQQLYRGVRVWGGDAILHAEIDGRTLPMTDALHRGIELDPTPTLAVPEILALAHQNLASKGSYSADPHTELVILPLQTRVPIPGLDHVASNAIDFMKRTDGFVLAYHVHLELEDPLAGPIRMDYLIHAHTGQILQTWDTLHTTGATGTGKSQYSGNVTFQTNTTASGFELRDTTRGNTTVKGGVGNVVTDMANGEDAPTSYILGTVFTDADNAWGDGGNYLPGNLTTSANGQTAAVDAAFGVGKTWDFYKKVLGRNGIDNLGTSTILRVHYRPTANPNGYNNAFWDDTCFCMTFGDGSFATTGTNFTTLTSLDVAGHEMSHGVCATAVPGGGLTYSGESGGLNEANSDIFGTMVEFYARGGVTGGYTDGTDSIGTTGGNWTIGEQLATKPLRYMYKPSLDGASADAWSTSVGSLNVHYSSGPMNRAFYFLSQGSSSLSSADAYTAYLPSGMVGLGNDKAARIWYRALTTYLTPSSDYLAARQASVRSATDLFGSLSTAYVAVQNAFHGINVGIAGDGVTTEDLTPPTVSALETGSGGMITLTATATDNRGVARVDYSIDGAFVGTSSIGPNYTVTTDSTKIVNGSHALVAHAFDTSGNVGTSASYAFSTNNATSEYLLNPSFEWNLANPDNWTVTTNVFNSGNAAGAHDGTSWLWLCGYGRTYVDSAYQTVILPSGLASASLSFWIKISSEDAGTVAHDLFKVQVRDASGVVLATLDTLSNLDKTGPATSISRSGTYVQKTYDLLPYKGKTVQIYVEGSEDASLITNFEVDDFHLTGTQSNVGPTLAITSPTNGVTVASGISTPFTATASDSNGVNTATFTWSWGDGTANTTGTLTPTHTFTNTGVANLTRTVTFAAADTLGASSNTAISVIVRPKLDLNADGTVDLLDLLTFAKYYGTTNATCDLNGDGTVGEADLTILLAGL